jgi:uncharacterized damage-inducible protein DinB
MTPGFSVLAGLLDQVMAVVRQLSDDEYCMPGPGGVSGSVGQHVRHSLDHVHALEQALRTHHLDYDARQRGGVIESSRQAALAGLESARARLVALDDRWLGHTVTLMVQLAPDSRVTTVASTIGRELAFVISHTIHHNATVNVLLQQRRLNAPPRFGYAASTPCALSA